MTVILCILVLYVSNFEKGVFVKNSLAKVSLTILISMMLFLVSACNQEKAEVTAYKSIATVGLTYNLALPALNSLYEADKLTDEQVGSVIKVARGVRTAGILATNELEVFMKNPVEGNLDIVKNAVTGLLQTFDEFEKLSKQYGVDKLPEATSVVTEENAKIIATSDFKE